MEALNLYQYDALATEEFYHLFIFATSEQERDAIFTSLTKNRADVKWDKPNLVVGVDWLFKYASAPGYIVVEEHSENWEEAFEEFLFETPLTDAQVDEYLATSVAGSHPVTKECLYDMGSKVHMPFTGPYFVEFTPEVYDVKNIVRFHAVQSL